MKKNISLFIFCLFFLFPYNTNAQEPILLSGNNDSYSVTYDNLSIYIDTTNSLTIKDVSNPSFSKAFRAPKMKKSTHLIEKWGVNYWVKINVKALDSTSINRKWVFEFQDRILSYLEIYREGSNEKFIMSKAGSTVNYKDMDYQSQSFLFDIYPTNKSQVIYFKFRSIYATFFKSNIKALPVIIKQVQFEQFFQGINLGIIVLMFFYSLLMFFTLQEKMFLYYSFYLLAAIYVEAVLNNWGFQYLWPNFAKFNPFIFDFERMVYLIAFALYTNAFLNTKKNFPVLIMILISIALAVYKKIPYSNYFLLGTSYYYIDQFIFSLGIHKYVDLENFFHYSFSLASLIEIGFFSYALVKRTQEERKDKQGAIIATNIALEEKKSALQDKYVLAEERNQLLIEKQLTQEEMLSLKDNINKDLENQVRLRTKELDLKNTELKSLYDQMATWNISLDKQNWDLSKDIKELHKQNVLGQRKDEEYELLFPDEISCFKFLDALKWGDGFQCELCRNTKWSKGQSPFSRVCTKCGNKEYLFKHTLHEGSKIPLKKAFYMIYAVYHTNGKITAKKLSETLLLQERSCWGYKKKVMDRMNEYTKSGTTINGWQELLMNRDK